MRILIKANTRMVDWKQRVQSLWPGACISVIVASAALFLTDHYGAPVMLLALLLGMAVNFLSQDGPCKPGVEFVARHVLRWGVGLLGLKMTLTQVQALGWQSFIVVVIAVVATVGFGILLSRWLGQKTSFGLLSGGAVGICGASAALAISSAMPADPNKNRDTLFVVISVSTLSTLAMVFYPTFTQWLALDPQQAGFFLGGTIHDVAQVVGAGYSIGQLTGDTATVVKLMRVLMLAPAVVATAWLTRTAMRPPQPRIDQTSRCDKVPLIPGFVVTFVGLLVANSLLDLPRPLVTTGDKMSQMFLVCAMAAIGMKTHIRDILRVGWKPVFLVVMETLFLALVVCLLLRWITFS